MLDPSAWDITTSAVRRQITRDGQEITLTDAVLRAVRRRADPGQPEWIARRAR